MLIPFKIDYSEYNEDASPIGGNTNIKLSHNKLVSQKKNAEARAEWGRKNPDKVNAIGIKAGETSKSKERREKTAELGKKFGPENAVKYIPIETKKRNGKNYGKQNLCAELICEKCGKTTNKGNYRFHGKNCKEIEKIKFIDLLPDVFTKSIAKKVAEENSIDNWISLNIFHKNCLYTKCIKKVNKPNQFNPSLYGKNTDEITKLKIYLEI